MILWNYNIGETDEDPVHWLLLDRKKRLWFIGPKELVYDALIQLNSAEKLIIKKPVA